jgi:beta-N-acetylhexosaminidase
MVAVAPLQFPGQGASDRNPDTEITTLHKSLDVLRQTDLVPFFAVTGRVVSDSLSVADALMMTQVRLQGLQGGRQTTQPLSFDQQTLNQLLALPEMARQWRPDDQRLSWGGCHQAVHCALQTAPRGARCVSGRQ